MNQSSQLAQSLLIPLGLRLQDCRDWIGRVPLPEHWSVTAHTWSDREFVSVCLSLQFPSYKQALSWAWMHTKFADSRHGFDTKIETDRFMLISLSDFEINVSYPPETHPDHLQPELASIKP